MDTSIATATSTFAEFSTSKTIAAELRDRGGALTFDEVGRFVLIREGRTIARGATLQEVALGLALVRRRRPRYPWVAVKLNHAILDDLEPLMDRGESLSALIRGATAAEVLRRRQELAAMLSCSDLLAGGAP